MNMCTISDELMESYQASLLSGQALRIPIKKLESIYSYVPSQVTNGKFDIPLSRAYTRLCTLFVSFVREAASGDDAVLTTGEGKLKLCNSFYVHTGSSESLEYQLQMGTKRMPDNNARGFAEHWYRLQHALGIASSLSHSSGITFADYATQSYCQVFDTEAIPQLASSGENLSNTSTIFVKEQGFGTTADHLPSRAHLIASYDAVIECRDTMVEIFE